MSREQSTFPWTLATIVWALLAGGVWLWTTNYEFTTDDPGGFQVDFDWPRDSELACAEERPTLLVFIHPRCPCTKATMGELERLLTGMGLSEEQRPKTTIVASVPVTYSEKWQDSKTLRQAAKLPNVDIVFDEGGAEARRFEAKTSGTLKLFKADGELLFTGGITASRGHEGANVGRSRLHDLLSSRLLNSQKSTPVFGCQLCIEEKPQPCCNQCCDQPNRSSGTREISQ